MKVLTVCLDSPSHSQGAGDGDEVHRAVREQQKQGAREGVRGKLRIDVRDHKEWKSLFAGNSRKTFCELPLSVIVKVVVQFKYIRIG